MKFCDYIKKTYNESTEDSKQYYYVGSIGEGMCWKNPRAANIRRIGGYLEAYLMFDKLLPTMKT